MQDCSINITRTQWINPLRPNDAIWWHRFGSTLAQVMACCLMAPSHYLNECWLIICKIQSHSSDGSFTRDTSSINDSWFLYTPLPPIPHPLPPPENLQKSFTGAHPVTPWTPNFSDSPLSSAHMTGSAATCAGGEESLSRFLNSCIHHWQHYRF